MNEKIYYNDIKTTDSVPISEVLYDLGITLRNDGNTYINSLDLDNILDNICDKICDNETIIMLNSIGIHCDVKFQLSKDIYEIVRFNVGD